MVSRAGSRAGSRAVATVVSRAAVTVEATAALKVADLADSPGAMKGASWVDRLAGWEGVAVATKVGVAARVVCSDCWRLNQPSASDRALQRPDQQRSFPKFPLPHPQFPQSWHACPKPES